MSGVRTSLTGLLRFLKLIKQLNIMDRIGIVFGLLPQALQVLGLLPYPSFYSSVANVVRCLVLFDNLSLGVKCCCCRFVLQ